MTHFSDADVEHGLDHQLRVFHETTLGPARRAQRQQQHSHLAAWVMKQCGAATGCPGIVLYGSSPFLLTMMRLHWPLSRP